MAYPVQAELGLRGSLIGAHPSLFALLITRPLPSIEGPVIFVVAAVVITAIVALLLSDRYTAHIARTLDRLVDRSKRVAAGHLDDVVSDTPPVEAELANLDDAISSMITSLRAANEVESTYILAISHDLRTPLTSIRGFAEAIIDEAVTSPVEAAKTIQREAQRVERLINDLIALARLRASDYSLTNQRIDLNELIGHLIEAVSPAAERHGLELAISLPTEATTIEIDPERLLQLLGNLLDNALKYAKQVVTVRLTTTSSEATVTVSDDGDGFPDSLRAQLFAQQLNPTPGRDGTVGSGLGLLIVGRLAAHMGLTIKVEQATAPLNGTTFRITIPRTIDHARSPRAQSTSAIVPTTPP